MQPANIPAGSPGPTPLPSRKRADIQGLRAICMVQVLLFHAWHVGSPIGVDAFIMISAFLMTSSFVRRSEAGSMPHFLERWANTFKRLLPPLVLVVLATVGASLAILPQNRWPELLTQAFASLTYWQNWRLVQVATDYYADDHGLASPLQHLWSMSMQGQVFLLWPLIMTVCVLLARATGQRIRTVTFGAFALLSVASLAWLLTAAPTDGSVYFDTRARIWEFAFGSALAVAAPRLRTTRALGRLLAGLGLIVLVVYSLVSIGTYPGPMAVVPMLAVSMVLLFPTGEERMGVGSLLALGPLVWLGGISYSVYLVHWPIFVLYLNLVGRSALGIIEGLLLILVSVFVAWLVTRFVDDPVRNWSWANRTAGRKALVAGLCLVAGLTPLAVTQMIVVQARRASMVPESGAGSAEFPGARALLDGAPTGFTADPIPGPLNLDAEWATFPERCLGDSVGSFDADELEEACSLSGNAPDATARVLIGGDSHTEQTILPQVEPLIQDQGWVAEAFLKGACSWGMPEAYEGECRERNEKLLAYADEVKPDYAFLIVTAAAADSPGETLRPGVEELIRHLTARGTTVVGVRDNLRSEHNLYECSSERDPDEPFGGCLLNRAIYFDDVNPAQSLTDIEGFHLIDMMDAYCTYTVCPTIIGNIHVYLDANHLTQMYSTSVAPFFSQRVRDELGIR